MLIIAIALSGFLNFRVAERQVYLIRNWSRLLDNQVNIFGENIGTVDNPKLFLRINLAILQQL